MPRYLLDVNVLVALAWPNHVHHARAQAWWSGVDQWATTPVTESAFIRLSINRSVVGRTVTAAEALAMLRTIRQTPGYEFIADTSSLAESAVDLSRLATPAHVTDAHLVNIAAGAGARLATLDAQLPEMLEPEDRAIVLVLP